jgi:hypothetical protein
MRPAFSASDLLSYSLVFTNHIWFVAVLVATPALAAASKCTKAVSRPPNISSNIIRLLLPYVSHQKEQPNEIWA